jgi:hypothetical protein
MRKIIQILKGKGLDLSQMRALEVFAREGDWQTIAYADEVKSLEAWEINPVFKNGLRKNLPKAKIKITDSIKEIKKKEHFDKFDFIVVDNPQNCYGPNSKYCEHFDVIPDICRLLNKKGIIIFNINKNPFNFKRFPRWQEMRAKFYERKGTNRLSIQWLLNFYKNLFKKSGYSTKFCFNVMRTSYLHYLVYFLQK